ncbi:MAG TPA: RNA polymerase sigma factor [Bacteroidales bacterium]|nr:RNA polymerase sigma factor [Bacteroidales bacterium]HRZ77840.1 RNA polymerase sigma factor [Bacteroidales bacterium]
MSRTYGMAPEETLIQGCQAGKRKSQSQLYRMYAPQMLGVCLRYAPDRATAEDILQDGFIKVFLNIGSYRGEGSFEGWIRRIMMNTALSWFKASRRQGFPEDIDGMEERIAAGEETEEGEALLARLKPEEVMALIQRLPEGYRMVLNLYVFEGLSHREIARSLEITENTSKSQLSKARRFLRRLLESEEKEREYIPVQR